MLFFLFALMAFMPKENFYYLLEQELYKQGVVLSGETLRKSLLLHLNAEALEVSFKGIESAQIADAKLMLLGLYNSVVLRDVKLSSLVESYLPADVATIRVHYSVINPLELTFEAEGDFGSMEGSFAFLDKNLTLTLLPSTLMQMQYLKSLKMFKKAEDGGYSYAKTF